MKEGYYANDPPKERRRDRGGEREEARDALPFARYRIVTRAFTRRTPPQDGRGADLCQSPEEESLKSILCEDTQPLSRSPHPRGGGERERGGAPCLVSRETTTFTAFAHGSGCLKLKRPPSFVEYRCHYESFRCSTECNVFVLSRCA